VPTALTGLFFIVLVFLGLFAEVFEGQAPEVDLAQIYANPIPVAELQRLRSLRLTNKQGNFYFENSHPDGELQGPWQMLEPQALRAKSEVIPRLVEALNVIRVRNFHRLEPINVSSFSLDNPTMTITFQAQDERSYEIKMGLINPIDNSAYMTISTQGQIYQIDPLEMALESYDLTQLAESKVLALNLSSLISVELTPGQGTQLKLARKGEGWVDQAGAGLSQNKVEGFLQRLENLKSTSILDNLNEDQREFLDRALSSPSYQLRLISNQGIRSYLVGELKGQIPGLSTDAKFIFSSEDKRSYVLLDREQARVFQTRQGDLK
jgi:hypothetical protein